MEISFLTKSRNCKHLVINETVSESKLTRVQTLHHNLQFDGKIFVFTGALEQFSRSKAKEMVEKFGGRASESVSKNTDYVIAGPGAGYKKRKAKELGIDILTEEEFFKLMKI